MSHERQAVSVFVKLDNEGGTTTRDIGIDGASVLSPERPAIGSTVDFALMWDDVTHHASGRVVDHKADGFDLQFEESTSRFHNAVTALLKEVRVLGK